MKRVYKFFKNIYHLWQAVFANYFFGFPSKKIKIIGITGTNGKTTTTWMINKILEESGFRTAVSSTINFKINEKEWINKTKFTTRSAWQTQKFIKQAVKAKCDYLVMETSSHALDQDRIWGVDYDVAVVTNITREHLDYHHTMEEYKEAKLKLFKNIGRWSGSKNEDLKTKNNKVIIVNLEMGWVEDFLSVKADEKYGYSIKNPNSISRISGKFREHDPKFKTINAEKIRSNSIGSEFMIQNSEFKIHLPGEWNIENSLAAVCVGLSQGVNLMTCSKALEKIKKVPGRMDYVENNRGFKIIIDYALTPDSMEKLGQLARKITGEHKIIWVFGACGERDRGKRPMMGVIGAKYADTVIVTNEDPYGENEENIIDEILGGIAENHKLQITNYKKDPSYRSKIIGSGELSEKVVYKIIDRKTAIKKALEIAQKEDLILITGKGAEETMAIGDKRISWNDRKVVEELLN